MRARRQPSGQYTQFWVELLHYPALLALRAASLAAVAAGHDDVLLRLLREPTWHDRLRGEREVPALDALHAYRVLDHNVINSFPRWNGQKWLWPQSHLLKDDLRLALAGDEESYIRLCDRTEYRTALAQKLFSKVPGSYRASPGEFIGEWQWGSDDTLISEIDFREHADREVWALGDEVENGPFDQRLKDLSDELKKSRRFG